MTGEPENVQFTQAEWNYLQCWARRRQCSITEVLQHLIRHAAQHDPNDAVCIKAVQAHNSCIHDCCARADYPEHLHIQMPPAGA